MTIEAKEELPGSDKESGWAQALKNLFLKRKVFWALTVLILCADLWTKEAAVDFVDDQGDGRIYYVEYPWFALVNVTNKGGPWGMGSEFSKTLRVARLLALGFILYILMGTPHSHRFQVIFLALVMGGAVGNIWDSWVYGHVRDFLYFDLGFPPADPWPAFNLADSMICLGVFGLLCVVISGTFIREGRDKKGSS